MKKIIIVFASFLFFAHGTHGQTSPSQGEWAGPDGQRDSAKFFATMRVIKANMPMRFWLHSDTTWFHSHMEFFDLADTAGTYVMRDFEGVAVDPVFDAGTGQPVEVHAKIWASVPLVQLPRFILHLDSVVGEFARAMEKKYPSDSIDIDGIYSHWSHGRQDDAEYFRGRLQECRERMAIEAERRKPKA